MGFVEEHPLVSELFQLEDDDGRGGELELFEGGGEGQEGAWEEEFVVVRHV